MYISVSVVRKTISLKSLFRMRLAMIIVSWDDVVVVAAVDDDGLKKIKEQIMSYVMMRSKKSMKGELLKHFVRYHKLYSGNLTLVCRCL